MSRALGKVSTKVSEARKTRAATKSSSAGPVVLALVATLVGLFVAFGFALSYVQSTAATGEKISLSQTNALAKAHRITSAVFLDEDNVVQLKVLTFTELSTVTDSNIVPEGGTAYVSYPQQGTLTQSLAARLEGAGAQVTIDGQDAKQRVKLVLQFLLPVLILANVFALLLTAGRGSGGAIGGVVSFGSLDSSRRGGSTTTFNDVGGADEAIAELAEIRDYLTNPAKYEALGAAPPKGVMLFGPPGTGKTLLAKAVAGEAGVPFFSVAGAQFVESLVGVGAARVRDLFKRVNAVAPAILFIDEIDAVGRKRGGGGSSGGSDEREQTLNQLLVEMDGFDVSAGVVVIGATNRPDILDPALMRPGRFDRHVTVERPDVEGRELILGIHARNKPVSAQVDLANIAHRTPGFTGADLASVVNEAALLTIRLGADTITNKEFDEAIDRVLSGPRRRGRALSAEEQRRAAIHEAGHAVVVAGLGHAEDVSRISVLPRGRNIATTTLAEEDSVLTRSQLLTKLTTLMAGTAAERFTYGEISTGSEDDLDEATDLARDIVARYGMSEHIGTVRLLARAGNAFLGDVPPVGDISPALREALDAEISNLITDAEKRAAAQIRKHEGALNMLADFLIEHETVEGEPLQQLLLSVTDPAGFRSGGVRAKVEASAAKKAETIHTTAAAIASGSAVDHHSASAAPAADVTGEIPAVKVIPAAPAKKAPAKAAAKAPAKTAAKAPAKKAPAKKTPTKRS